MLDVVGAIGFGLLAGAAFDVRYGNCDRTDNGSDPFCHAPQALPIGIVAGLISAAYVGSVARAWYAHHRCTALNERASEEATPNIAPPPVDLPTLGTLTVRRQEDAAALTKDAIAAAHRGDCSSVRLLDPQVLKLDAPIHANVFLADVEIKRCLEAPAPAAPTPRIAPAPASVP